MKLAAPSPTLILGLIIISILDHSPLELKVHFGAPWPTSFAYLLRAKISAMPTHRKIAQEGHRFTPSEALQAGIIDETVRGGTEDVLASALKLAETKASMAKGGVWGLIKVSQSLLSLFSLNL